MLVSSRVDVVYRRWFPSCQPIRPQPLSPERFIQDFSLVLGGNCRVTWQMLCILSASFCLVRVVGSRWAFGTRKSRGFLTESPDREFPLGTPHRYVCTEFGSFLDWKRYMFWCGGIVPIHYDCGVQPQRVQSNVPPAHPIFTCSIVWQPGVYHAFQK